MHRQDLFSSFSLSLHHRGRRNYLLASSHPAQPTIDTTMSRLVIAFLLSHWQGRHDREVSSLRLTFLRDLTVARQTAADCNKILNCWWEQCQSLQPANVRPVWRRSRPQFIIWGEAAVLLHISSPAIFIMTGEQYKGTHHLLLEQYGPGVLKANSAFNTDIRINIQDQLIVLISFLVVKATLEIVT